MFDSRYKRQKWFNAGHNPSGDIAYDTIREEKIKGH